jgi:hypothetical protein
MRRLIKKILAYLFDSEEVAIKIRRAISALPYCKRCGYLPVACTCHEE